MTRTTISKCSI